MDIVFHATAGVSVASFLGESRRKHLAAAAVIGALPDLIWSGYCLLKGGWTPLPLAHSLRFNAVVLVVLALVNWRIALGLPLHLAIDMPLHKHTLLYQMLDIPGITWHEGNGWFITAGLWMTLVCLNLLRLRAWRLRAAAVPETVQERH